MSPLRGALHLPVNTLALRRGGLVKAVMLRANALAAANERDVIIEVLAFQPRLEEDIADLVDRGFLDARVHVRSILRCLDPSGPGPSAADPIARCVHHGVPFGSAPRVGAPAVTAAADPRAGVLAEPHRGFAQGLVLAMAPRRGTHDELGRPRHADVFDRRGALVRREEIGSGDRVARVLDHRAGRAGPVAHRWIGRDGRCFLSVWPTPGGDDWALAFAATDGFEALPNPKALYRLAFERALGDEEDPVLFSEFREGLPNIPGRGFDEVALAIRHPSLRRVAVLHSNHALQGEQALPLRSSPNFRALLNGLTKWDLLVTATERQREDIAEQYGSPERVLAIPHYATAPPASVVSGDWDPNRFVLVARIHRKKRVDEAIEAFRLVVDQLPGARLHVYGFGYGDGLESQMKELVNRLELADHVHFSGFVEDVSDVYTGACASFQTSESEGFGMALLESLAHGVPVVAYDVSYGAREVIRDGVDGHVVPWGDRTSLARRLVELSTRPELRDRLAAEGPVGAARFSRDRYVREWTTALDALPTRKTLDTSTTANVTSSGQVRLQSAFAGMVVLRLRGSREEAATRFVGGKASVSLPSAAPGDIVDVFLRAEEDEYRAVFAGGDSEHPDWRVYATTYKNLSMKMVPRETAQEAGGLSRVWTGRSTRLLGRRFWNFAAAASRRRRFH